ncbi:MAG: Druantia anti-phage system protein DruA [Acidimicrobiales bacterium]
MSDVLLSFRGREIRAADVAFLRELIATHPTLSRCALSVRVCQAWNWVQPNGQWRDQLCRSLMLRLHRAGLITLPAPRLTAVNNAIRHRRVRAVAPVDATPVTGSLADLEPLVIRQVRRAPGEDLFAHLVQAHHYLGYSRPVGEHLKYVVFTGERPLACLSWSSAPLRLNLRDQFLGAPKAAYQHHLHLIAYNSRFLVLPWVRIPHLASRLLARVSRQIAADWQALYQHPVVLLESFVDTGRFRGTCYQAANWQRVGRSTGRGTKAKPGAPKTSIKELWVYPLTPDYRARLLAP